MTIAEGRTICKAERDIVLQGFAEQLQILEDSQVEQENVFKAQLYDIITNYSISDDEKSSLMYPWSNELQELEERHIRSRRSVLIGLYSFWEVSLQDIANAHIPTMVDYAHKTQKSKNFGASDYLKLIYGSKLPSSVNLIDNNIREFRNYLVHGTLTETRKSLINDLKEKHPEFCIKNVCKTYIVSNYKGLRALLGLFSRELDNAETKILEIENNNPK